jgi:hypothetical protein
LARKLAGAFRGKTCDIVTRFQFPRRKPIEINAQAITETNIAVLAAPDLQTPWNDKFLHEVNATVKFVHFVRDPRDMILSAFLYHAQEEAPALELWLKSPSFNPCEFDHHSLFDRYAVTIGAYNGDYAYVTNLITETIKYCNGVMETYNNHRGMGYNKLLRSMPVEEGILLEAARSILSSSGGDILRMATNAVYEMHTVNVSSRRVFLSDFPIGDAQAFLSASRTMYSFLMCNAPAGGQKMKPFWSCMTVDRAVQLSVEAAFVPSHAGGNKTGGSHVTQGMLSRSDRDALLLHLSRHPAIGPLLAIVSDIVHQNISVSEC